jgi:hypothetical protein
MTAIVGVFCKDGVVVGSDSSATFGQGTLRTIEQQTEKIDIIGEHVIVACTGSIGYAQRFSAIVKKMWGDNEFRGSEIEVAKRLSRATLEDFSYTYGAKKPLDFGALVAFPIEHRHHLCEFGTADFQPEMKTDRIWYCSMGSGQQITDPFLGLMREAFWETGPPPVQGGIFAATWTLEHVIALNPGGVNGPSNIAVLERIQGGRLKARLFSQTELDQHRQNVAAAMTYLGKFQGQLQPSASVDLPASPKP